MSVCLTNDPQQFFDTRCIAFVVWLFGIRQSIYLECFVFFIENLWKLRTFSLPLCFLSPWVFWWLIAVHCFSHTFHPLRHTWLLALIFPNREATHWKSSILYSIIGLVSYKSFNSLFLVDLENLYLFTFFSKPFQILSHQKCQSAKKLKCLFVLCYQWLSSVFSTQSDTLSPSFVIILLKWYWCF